MVTLQSTTGALVAEVDHFFLRSCHVKATLGFAIPSSVPSSVTNWWCDHSTEYAFVGVSYENQFEDIRKTFKGRYVRIYGACDREGFYNDVIEAAWDAGVGVHALIWFGWSDPNIWKTRRDNLLGTLHSNPKAKFVTRVVQFGSEPLYDNALDVNDLAAQIKAAKANLSSLAIPVTISELAYGYQERAKSDLVMSAIDFVDAHMLPFFAQDASVASQSWPDVENDINWFVKNGQGKKIYLSQVERLAFENISRVQPNSASAVANVQQEEDYFNLLDEKCTYFKSVAGDGIGWFAHIYSEDQEPGYGLYGSNGVLKFPFSPKTSC
ncbi:hypothetical protein CPB84DRAFT_1814592 [Gymnopilus junonius]|uniref:glucan endo-1,3-beta-D-glucosidase n=1 Tax=Gymnopilus junonius TaxID=109634 RepID=A0A9P5NTV8_GYMJU|nr:hypothetical protein CPB84DRAFT_1814592 [Gymnopilus junonius]